MTLKAWVVFSAIISGTFLIYSVPNNVLMNNQDEKSGNNVSRQNSNLVDLKEGRVQGLFDTCNVQAKVNESQISNNNCTLGPPIEWDTISCLKNQSGSSTNNILTSTKLGHGGKYKQVNF